MATQYDSFTEIRGNIQKLAHQAKGNKINGVKRQRGKGEECTRVKTDTN